MDSTFIMLIPFILLSMWASSSVQRTFNKFNKVKLDRNITGLEAARKMLEANGLYITVERSEGGPLSDHYDPRTRTVRLSEAVYDGNTISAVSVACHEVGHAIQHANGYSMLEIRNSIFPVVRISSSLWIVIFMVGLISSIAPLMYIGIALFSALVLFQIITLPVEFDASARALKEIERIGIMGSTEIGGAKKVLRAAAFTYVAAMLSAVANLARLIIITSRRD